MMQKTFLRTIVALMLAAMSLTGCLEAQRDQPGSAMSRALGQDCGTKDASSDEASATSTLPSSAEQDNAEQAKSGGDDSAPIDAGANDPNASIENASADRRNTAAHPKGADARGDETPGPSDARDDMDGGVPSDSAGSTAAAGTSAASVPAKTRDMQLDCELPACLAQLVSRCPPAGACSQEFTGIGVRYCYDNGVEVVRDVIGGGFKVRAPDGSACFSFDLTTSGIDTTADYLAPSGAPVATAVQNSTDGTWTITCAQGKGKVLHPRNCGQDVATVPATADTSGCDRGSCSQP